MATTERRRPARERLLTAADELMFVEGVVLTPVDVILRRAGASPATLYANFGNKDGLIAAALERRLAEWTEVWDAAIAAAQTPTDRLLAIFPALRTYQRERLDERWCAFSGTAAATGKPAAAVAEMLTAEDTLLHERIESLSAEVVPGERGVRLADEVVVAYLGAITGMLRGDQERAIAAGERTAAHLVEVALAEA
ncbi:TetR/AcrR family transcriptional regulator [Janibacter sp. FSL W8-0316]|uniref:TetR/AcrR family transcriptional regulator n=1 Tax=Janibacter TaxID=53457 RepID=UPI0030FB1755